MIRVWGFNYVCRKGENIRKMRQFGKNRKRTNYDEVFSKRKKVSVPDAILQVDVV